MINQGRNVIFLGGLCWGLLNESIHAGFMTVMKKKGIQFQIIQSHTNSEMMENQDAVFSGVLAMYLHYKNIPCFFLNTGECEALEFKVLLLAWRSI